MALDSEIGPESSLPCPGKWAGEVISLPLPHISLKINIRQYFWIYVGMRLQIICLNHHAAYIWPLPVQANGPEKLFQPPHHISPWNFTSDIFWDTWLHGISYILFWVPCGPYTAFAYPYKWAGEVILVPYPHISLKINIRQYVWISVGMRL